MHTIVGIYKLLRCSFVPCYSALALYVSLSKTSNMQRWWPRPDSRRAMFGGACFLSRKAAASCTRRSTKEAVNPGLTRGIMYGNITPVKVLPSRLVCACGWRAVAAGFDFHFGR